MNAMRDFMQAFWMLAVGVVVLYVFLVALGAFAPDDAWAVTALAGVLVVMLAIHFARVRRELDREGPNDARRELNQMRERRGF